MSSNRSRSPLVVGPLAGIAAFVVGYVLTYAWQGRNVEEALEPLEVVLALFQAEPVGTWRVVGWLFYSAHFVETRVSAEFGPIEATSYVNLVEEGSGNLELLYLLPPLLLLAAGFLVAATLGVEDVTAGAKVGASTAVGYLFVVLVGLVVFSYSGARPDWLRAVVVAGVLYPLAFGGIGGALASQVTGKKRESRL